MRVVFLLLLLLCSAGLAEPTQPWVQNGRWKMKAERVRYINDLETYQSLPWGSDMQEDTREKHMQHLKKAVFGSHKKVAIVTFTGTNSSAETLKIGSTRPYWVVRLSDGQQVSNNHSFMRQTSRFLTGGMPEVEQLAPGETKTWELAFFIPDYCSVNTLFFRSPGHLEKSLGPTESIVLRLASEKVKGGKQLSGPTDSAVPWQETPGWKMRVTASEYIDSAENFGKLPWSERMVGETKEKQLRYMSQQVFGKGKSVVLLFVELKNTGGDKQKVGAKRPYWLLTGADSSVVNNGNSFVRKVPFLLSGGLPQETLLNSGATVRGWLAFVLPKGVEAATLHYKSPGHLGKSFGKTGSVQMPVP